MYVTVGVGGRESNPMRWLLSGVIITIIANTITVIGHWPDANGGQRTPHMMQLWEPRYM